MSRRAGAWTDEYELLCERCGYSIEGLPRGGKCPECGRPVAQSLPEARRGTPWQRSPGAGAWLATLWLCIRHPVLTAKTARMDGSAASLGRINARVAASVLTVFPGLAIALQVSRREAPYSLRDLTWPWAESSIRWLICAAIVLGWWLALAAAFFLLTAIETRGIQIFSRVHKSRITPTAARTITAHATSGWVAGAVLVSAGFALGLGVYEHAMHHNVGILRGPMMLSPIWLPVALALAGLLIFECIVYAGVLNCRFANRARTDVERRPRTPQPPRA